VVQPTMIFSIGNVLSICGYHNIVVSSYSYGYGIFTFYRVLLYSVSGNFYVSEVVHVKN
jgi:hypothetical protein